MRLASILHTTERAVKIQGFFMLQWIGLLWLFEIVDFFWLGRLDMFGIEPRQVSDLLCIATAPFVHFGFGHLMANTIPLLVLGWLTLATGWRRFWITSIFVAGVSGLGIWIFGRSSGSVIMKHGGVSTLIFGYFGYLLAFGIFQRSVLWIVISAAVGLIYGTSIFAGVLPGKAGVSWEGHLFGFVAGLMAAWLLRPRSSDSVRGERS